jgi:hypothetical protein
LGQPLLSLRRLFVCSLNEHLEESIVFLQAFIHGLNFFFAAGLVQEIQRVAPIVSSIIALKRNLVRLFMIFDLEMHAAYESFFLALSHFRAKNIHFHEIIPSTDTICI